MTKVITNAVLAEKIDNLHIDIKEMKPAVKENTEFRLRSTGMFTAIGVVATVVGGLIITIVNKFWK